MSTRAAARSIGSVTRSSAGRKPALVVITSGTPNRAA
jgi:hypothetical protein